MSIQERTTSRRSSREARRPDFIVRAPDPNRRGRWVTLGAGWNRDDGGMNIKLQTVPVGGWDGALVALPPLSDGGEPEPDVGELDFRTRRDED